MRTLVLASMMAASGAFAGLDDMRSMIQSNLGMTVDLVASDDAVVCSPELYCPIADVPSKTFEKEGGFITSQAATCCPALFTECQVKTSSQYCRDLMFYTIPDPSGQSQDVCPPTTTECTCQENLSGEKFLRLNFCPATTPCCPICECHGDPHCRSFQGDNSIWATCDDRDPSCVHSQTTCLSTMYDKVTCNWITGAGHQPYCARAIGTKEPQMNMYSKKYQQYFTNDDKEYDFKLELFLGTYGSITRIEMTDTAKSSSPFVWYIDPAGKCIGNPTYPIVKGMAKITGLPSMVDMQFQCTSGGGRSPTASRFDVHYVKDPWFTGDHPLVNGFGGFCATGTIAEIGDDSAKGGCNTVDRQLTKYFGCTANADLTGCKRTWCNSNYFKLDYTNFAPTAISVAQKKTACLKYVNDVNNVPAFLASACSVSPAFAHGKFPQDPTKCESNADCKECMDNIKDFPEEIGLVLNGEPPVVPPKKVCNPDLLQVGLARKKLGISQSGIQIDYKEGAVWTGIFALFDIEIAQCDCKTLVANGTDPANQALMKPGQYRVKQCNGLNADPSQEMCISSPSYNTTITYLNPFDGAAVSTPYGTLYNEDKLVCNKAKYPGCPPDYSCCVWESSKGGWQACMVGAYGATFATKYPMCKFPNVTP